MKRGGWQLAGLSKVRGLRKPTSPFIFGMAVLGAAIALALPQAWAQNPVPEVPGQETVKTQEHPLPPLESSTKYEGETVTDIQFKGIAGTSPEMLRGLLLVKTGEPLSRDDLRESIRVLYLTGRFSSLHVEAEPAKGGGVALTFVSTENYFNGD